MKRSTIISQLLIIAGIAIVANLISSRLFLRADFTADKRYTLSKASRDVLRELGDVITVTAYFTRDLPPQLQKTRRDFEDLLIEYENRSGGNLVFEFVNPNADQESETQAQQKGISPVMVTVTKKDQAQQIRAYMGAILQSGERTEIIPILQPGAGMEYALTTSIKKLTLTDKPKIAFLQGHGEPAPSASMQVLEQLSVLYDVEPLTLSDTAEIPVWYKAVAMINPSDSLSGAELARIDGYLSRGGSFYLAYSNLDNNLNSQYLGARPDIGLRSWLAQKGITLQDQYVIDASCGAVTVRQQQGPFIINSQVQFPFFPILSNFAEHPVTEGLEAVFMPFVSALSFTAPDTSVRATHLALSSEQSGLVPAPTYIDINREWTQQDFTAPAQAVALALEGQITGSMPSRMVVVANGEFAVNGDGPQAQQINPDNVYFATNAIDWLADDTGLINLRTKAVTSRPLRQIDDNTRNLYKYGNVAVPVMLVLIIAFVRRQRYLRKKQQWIQGNY
jgi:gliding-associated putative ABC transporter substrate-binding component GldG